MLVQSLRDSILKMDATMRDILYTDTSFKYNVLLKCHIVFGFVNVLEKLARDKTEEKSNWESCKATG